MRSDYSNPVHLRVMGYLPLSIATALAFQTFLGYEVNDDQELLGKEARPAHLKYQDVWVNVSTLLRNFIGAMGGTEYETMDGGLILNELHNEMERLEQILKTHNPSINVTFYYCAYEDNPKRYPHAKLREAKTVRQIAYKDVHDTIINALAKVLEGDNLSNFQYFKNQILPGRVVPRKTVMLTHYPIDLLSQYYFGELHLIESHTGKIKAKSEWYTKFLNGKNLAKIPFLESTLQIFGDSETFSPLPMKYRKFLLDLADRNKWSNITTRDRIKSNLNYAGNDEMKDALVKFL